MSFYCSCKRNDRDVVIVAVPEVLKKSPTPKYLSLWADVSPYIAECEKGVGCHCSGLREISIGHNSECISIVFECGRSNNLVRNYADYCEKFLLGKERSAIRQKRIREASGRHKKNDLTKIATMQDFRCYFCDRTLYSQDDLDDEQELGKKCHWDHLKPLSRGGTNFPSNMALTCKECNLRKGNKTEEEYWLYLLQETPKEDINKRQYFHSTYVKEKRNLDLLYRKSRA